MSSSNRIGGVDKSMVKRAICHEASEYYTGNKSAYSLLLKQPNQPTIIYAVIYHLPELTKKAQIGTNHSLVLAVAKQLQNQPSA